MMLRSGVESETGRELGRRTPSAVPLGPYRPLGLAALLSPLPFTAPRRNMVGLVGPLLLALMARVLAQESSCEGCALPLSLALEAELNLDDHQTRRSWSTAQQTSSHGLDRP